MSFTRWRIELVWPRWSRCTTARELDLAEAIGAGLIGINNRDLHTFVTDIAVTEELLADYRGDALIVSESGIDSPADIRRLDAAGARAFLIGESLLRGGNRRETG